MGKTNDMTQTTIILHTLPSFHASVKAIDHSNMDSTTFVR